MSVKLPFDAAEGNVKVTQAEHISVGGIYYPDELYYSYDFGLSVGADVLSIADGVVHSVVSNVPDGDTLAPLNHGNDGDAYPQLGPGALGNQITIFHEPLGIYVTYAHLGACTIPFSKGDVVSQGDVIGAVGLTGTGTAPHLHITYASSVVDWGGKTSAHFPPTSIARGSIEWNPSDFALTFDEGNGEPLEESLAYQSQNIANDIAGADFVPKISTSDVEIAVEYSSSGYPSAQLRGGSEVEVNGKKYLYYSWLPFGNSEDVGLATSEDDGLTWENASSEPLIPRNDAPNWASFRIHPVRILHEDGQFKMWFWGNSTNLFTQTNNVHGFGYATSADGLTWDVRDQPIRVEAGRSEGARLLELVKVGELYHAYYWDMTDGQTPVLMLAISSDGETFVDDQVVGFGSGYQIFAATEDPHNEQGIVSVWRNDLTGQWIIATSCNGLSFEIRSEIDFPDGFVPWDLSIDGDVVTFFGQQSRPPIWQYGNSSIGMVEVPFLRSSNDTFTRILQDDPLTSDLLVTSVSEKILLADDSNILIGEASQFDGDFIVNFGVDDVLRFLFNIFSIDNLSIFDGSAILEIDTDQDGLPDTTVTLLGDYDNTTFSVENDGNDTLITYVLNVAPIAIDDSFDTDENAPVSGNVLADNGNGPDGNPDGGPLAVSLAIAPTSGLLTLDADGSFTFDPDGQFESLAVGRTAIDTFTYTVSDAAGETDTATVSITINGVNDAPVVAAPVSASAGQTDAAFSVDLLANATDPEGDALQVTNLTLAGGDASGVTVSGNGLTIDPSAYGGLEANERAEINYSYEIDDGNGGSVSQTATITITGADGNIPDPLLRAGPLGFGGSPRQAVILPHDDAYLLPNGTLEFTFSTDAVNGRRFLFSKDSRDFDNGGHLGVHIENGALVARIQSDADSFTAVTPDIIRTGTPYHVAVTFGAAGLMVYVNGQVEASNAYDGGLLVNQEPIVLGANQWSSDDLVANRLRDPFNGTLTDFALYGEALSDEQIEQLSIEAVGAPPQAKDDAFTVAEDTTLTAAAPGVLANDTDADGDPLIASVVTGPSNGSLTLNPDGSFTYTPDADFNGSDSFTYLAEDGTGGSDTATITITIDPVNDIPVADDAAFALSDAAETNDIVGTVQASDGDGDPLTFAIIDGNTDGVFDIDALGQVFVADPTLLDVDTAPSYALRVEASDGQATDTATVDITMWEGSVRDPLLEAGPFDFEGAPAGAETLPHQDSYLLAEGTLEFSLNADAVDGRRFLFSKDSRGFDSGGHLGVYIEDGAVIARIQSETDTFTATTGSIVKTGTPTHVAVTFGAPGLMVYVNGKAEATNAYDGGLLVNQEPIVLGANQWSSGDLIANRPQDPFDGTLTDFALYDSALNEFQIQALAENSFGEDLQLL